MRITIDTDKGIIIVPDTFKSNLAKQNAILAKAGVKETTEREFIEAALKEALARPILTKEQAKEWNPELENQIAK